MFCGDCGNELPEGARFCGACGAVVEPVAHGVAAPAAVSPIAVTRYAGFWRRMAAHLIDVAILWVALSLVSVVLAGAGYFYFYGFFVEASRTAATLLLSGYPLAMIRSLTSIPDAFSYGLWVGDVIELVRPFVILAYYVAFTGLRGQTPGKMALGIKVVRDDGRAPGLAFAALREIVGKAVSSVVVLLGFLWVAWDRRKQGWHDKIARTSVVIVR